MKAEAATRSGGMEPAESPLNESSSTLKDEEAKIRAEQKLVRKQVPINVHPYVASTMQGPPKSYQNPFYGNYKLTTPWPKEDYLS